MRPVEYKEWAASLKPHSFMLVTKTKKGNSKKTFYLIADDEDDRKKWARSVGRLQNMCGLVVRMYVWDHRPQVAMWAAETTTTITIIFDAAIVAVAAVVV